MPFYVLFVLLSANALTAYCQAKNSITPEQSVFATSIALNKSGYRCIDVDMNGFCRNTSSAELHGAINPSTNSDGMFLKWSNFTGMRLIQPNSSSRCWTDSGGAKCCSDPCEPNPCLNGNCRISSGESTFSCDCADGFRGDRCEVDELCEHCDSNAVCTQRTCKCKNGTKGDGTYCTAFCPKFVVTAVQQGCESNFSELTFPQSWEGVTQYSTETCNGRAVATIDCRTNLKYGVNVTKFDKSSLNCVPCTLTLDTMVNNMEAPENITVEAVQQDLTYLKVLSKNRREEENSVETIAGTTQCLENLASALESNSPSEKPKQINENAMRNVLEILGNIDEELSQPEVPPRDKNDLEPKPIESDKDRAIRKSTQKTARLIDQFSRAVNLTGKTEVEITTAEIALKITEPLKKEDNTFNAVKFEPVAYVKPSKNNTEPQSSAPIRKKVIKMTLPPEALLAMNELMPGRSTMRLVMVLHQDASHLTVDKRTGQVVQASFKPGEIGDVIQLGTTFQIDHLDPPEPTKTQNEAIEGLRLKIHKEYFCVFWDFLNKEWSNKGCKLNKGSTPIQCECTHFTSFALLLRVTTWLVDYEPDVFSIVACCVSVVCLIATILIYLLIKELRVRRPTPIMINIFVNLALGYLMFVVGMDGRYREFSDAGCYVSAVIMHSAFLCSWFWMLIYSLNMYYALVKVVGRSPLVSKKIFMYPIGYGIPFVIVATDLIVSAVLDAQEPGIEQADFRSQYISESVCWVRHFSMYLGFTGPVGIILLVNMILFVVTIRKLTWKRREIQSSKEAAKTSQQLFMAVTLISMMGLTWIFGYIMLVWDDPTFQEVFSIIFTILNTSQGLVIFLVSCVRQKTVRVLWMTPVQKFFGCGRCGKFKAVKPLGSESASNTASTGLSTLPRGSKGNNTFTTDLSTLPRGGKDNATFTTAL